MSKALPPNAMADGENCAASFARSILAELHPVRAQAVMPNIATRLMKTKDDVASSTSAYTNRLTMLLRSQQSTGRPHDHAGAAPASRRA